MRIIHSTGVFWSKGIFLGGFIEGHLRRLQQSFSEDNCHCILHMERGWREDKERANKTQWSERADSMDHLELKMKALSN